MDGCEEVEEEILAVNAQPFTCLSCWRLQAGIGDRSNMGFAGTMLLAGQATAIVVETGNRAEIGKIASLLGGVKVVTTPLLHQIELFGRTVGEECFWATSRWDVHITGWFLLFYQVSVLCIFIAIATFFIAWSGRGLPLFESLHAAVGVAVALIPEGALCYF